jgi:hypothetical protein
MDEEGYGCYLKKLIRRLELFITLGLISGCNMRR